MTLTTINKLEKIVFGFERRRFISIDNIMNRVSVMHNAEQITALDVKIEITLHSISIFNSPDKLKKYLQKIISEKCYEKNTFDGHSDRGAYIEAISRGVVAKEILTIITKN